MDQPQSFETMAAQTRPSHVRYFMLSFVLIATVLSYLDRMNLSIAAPFMAKSIGISKIDMGYLFSAFAWTYALGLIPGGYLADRLGSRRAYSGALLVWSLATALQGLSGGFAALFAARLVVGAAEAPAFPSNARAVTRWFPARERGFATAVYVLGQYIGTAIFSGLLLWMAVALGWRSLFFVTGLAGIVFAAVWYMLYRDPAESHANAAELAYIQEGGGETAPRTPQKFNLGIIPRLFGYRQIWAICFGKFASFATLTFFLTWFPTYLIEQRHMHMLKAGVFLVLPYLGASAGILIAGGLSDWLIRRGVSLSFARKAPLVAGSVLGMSIVLANVVQSNAACIAILSLAFFAQGLSSMSWAAVAEVAPIQYVGLTSGVTSLSANLAGIVVPIVIGYILHLTGSFSDALDFVGLLSFGGMLSYSLLLGRLHRIVLAD